MPFTCPVLHFQTCERLVQETCGGGLNVKFLGNAPCGFFKYKFPKTVRKEGFIGAKVCEFSVLLVQQQNNINRISICYFSRMIWSDKPSVSHRLISKRAAGLRLVKLNNRGDFDI